MGIISDAAFRRQFFRNAFRGVLGLAVLTPTIAVLQGKHLLDTFRENHKDAPFPDMPCSGVVVVHQNMAYREMARSGVVVVHPLPHQNNKSPQRIIKIPPKRIALVGSASKRTATKPSASSWFSSFPLLRDQKEPDPLRLLVVGDSLAAGVGVTKSGTPVLPEAIAKSLSSALGGRAVYWTCMGEPGLSSPQIVKELLLAQHENDEEQKDKPIDVMDKLQDWWQDRRRQQQQLQKESDNNADNLEDIERNFPETARKVRSWWKKTKTGVEKDLHELKERIHWEELGEAIRRRLDVSKKVPEPSILLPLRRRNTHVPDLVAQYDVAIVLTGFNDLKNMIFPLPEDPNEIQSRRAGQEDSLSSDNWFEKDLFSIMRALKGKMRNYGVDLDDEPEMSSSQAEIQEGCSAVSISSMEKPPRRHHPMVVFPATPLFAEQVYPLSLFANPIVALMEYQKKKLAEKYPAPVLFLEGPRQKVIADYLNKRGPLWEASSREEVLFELTNKARLEQLEKLMREYYETWTTDVIEEVPTYTYDVFGPDIQGPMQKIERSPLISPDNVHPSDEGYELWGRYIAEQIVEEWNREDSPSKDETVTERCTDHNFDGN